MNAAEQDDLAQRFTHACKLTRLRFERSQSIGGHLVYSEVPAEAILGRLLQFGWRVSVCEIPGQPVQIGGDDPQQMPLRLVDTATVADEDDAA